MKRILKDYFSFSKRERNAVIIILLLAAGFIALPYFFGIKKKPAKPTAQLQEQIAKLQESKPKQKSYQSYNNDGDNDWQQPYQASSNNSNASKGELFEYDPNTLDEAGWQRLGLRDKTIKTLLNYRSKGGKFKSPEDLRKVWGLKKEEADRIIPYARVASTNPYQKTSTPYTKNTSTTATIIDINTATVEQLKSLPGIDYSLPYKIIKFREKLGGFLNVQQLKETYGMADSVYQKILPYLSIQSINTKKININTASDYDLNMHPYIDKTVAKAIVIYRTQHGSYKTVDDVKKIVFITQEVFNKISPYLGVE
jgi:competence protein ComEA